jgi:hypothetical protein
MADRFIVRDASPGHPALYPGIHVRQSSTSHVCKSRLGTSPSSYWLHTAWCSTCFDLIGSSSVTIYEMLHWQSSIIESSDLTFIFCCVPLPLGSRTVPVPQPQQLLVDSHTILSAGDWPYTGLLYASQEGCLFKTGLRSKSSSKLSYDWRSVGQSVLISVHHLNPWYIFLSLARKISSDICGFILARRPLWREDGSIIYWYKCYWALPVPSHSGPCPTEHVTISYYLIWDWVPFLSHLNTRSVTVGVFYPASTQWNCAPIKFIAFIFSARTAENTPFLCYVDLSSHSNSRCLQCNVLVKSGVRCYAGT